jgi:hypothetical protein
MLIYRLQNLRESGTFQDSAQQALHTSTAVHTTKSIFCSFSALLIYASFITEVINQISSSAAD